MLGLAIANLLDKPRVERALALLPPQVDTNGPLQLAQQSGSDLENTRKLVEALCNGLTDNLGM